MAKKTPSPLLLATLQLIRSPMVGPKTFFKLIHTYGDAINALSYATTQHKIDLIDIDKVHAEYAKSIDFGAEFIMHTDEGYPDLLKHISDPPPVLVVKGQKPLLQKDILAVVGARNASLVGQQFAYKLASDLGKNGWVITSGNARGIDTSAHKGSLKTGTIAFLSGGINMFYPPENEKLFMDISHEGLIVSEMPFGTPPTPYLFPRRNRLIAGVAKGLCVIEAGLKSGTLLTADYAMDYGREIFVVPGFPLDPRSKGGNKMIKDGAHLIENAWDVDNILRPKAHQTKVDPPEFEITTEVSGVGVQLLDLLSTVPTDTDLLIAKSKLSAAQFWQIINQLEIEGKIARHQNKITLLLPQ